MRAPASGARAFRIFRSSGLLPSIFKGHPETQHPPRTPKPLNPKPLNPHIRDPTIAYAIFLKEGILEGLGASRVGLASFGPVRCLSPPYEMSKP